MTTGDPRAGRRASLSPGAREALPPGRAGIEPGVELEVPGGYQGETVDMLRWDREVSVLPRIARDTADLVRHAWVDQNEKQSLGLGLYTLPVLKSVRPSPKAKDRSGSSISPGRR